MREQKAVQVQKLEKQVTEIEKQIKAIQNGCEHNHVRVTEGPDSNAGWGGAEICIDCDKFLNAFTRRRRKNDKVRDYVRTSHSATRHGLPVVIITGG